MNPPFDESSPISPTHILLGKWLNWAIDNGFIYKNCEELSIETLSLLFPNIITKDMPHEEAIKKMLTHRDSLPPMEKK